MIHLNYNHNVSRYEFGMKLLEYINSTIIFVNLCEQNMFIPESIKDRMRRMLIILIDIVTLYTDILKNSK